jgi:hypothetical protein
MFGAILSMAKYALVFGAIEVVTNVFVPRASMPDQVIQSSLVRVIYYIGDCIQAALPRELQVFMREFSGPQTASEESSMVVDDAELKELGTLEPKAVDGATGGRYTSDQIDQLNRILSRQDKHQDDDA